MRTSEDENQRPTGDPPPPGRDEGRRRADRDGHRLRLPLGADRRGGRGRHRPRRRHRRRHGARLPGDRAGLDGRDGDAGQGCAARPEDAADGRRHADGLLRGQQRAGDRQRPAAGQGDRLPGGQARGRRHLRGPGPGDRQRRHPGDGPRRPHPPERHGARRLQDPGPHRRARREARRRGDGAGGRRLLRDRLRGGAGGGHRGDRQAPRGADDRDRRRPLDRRPGTRLPRPARDHGGAPAQVRQALRRDPAGDGRAGCATTWPRSAPARSPGPSTPTRSSPGSSRS